MKPTPDPTLPPLMQGFSGGLQDKAKLKTVFFLEIYIYILKYFKIFIYKYIFIFIKKYIYIYIYIWLWVKTLVPGWYPKS